MDTLKGCIEVLQLLVNARKNRVLILCVSTVILAIFCFSTSVHKAGDIGYYTCCAILILAVMLILLVALLDVLSGSVSPIKTLGGIREVADEIDRCFRNITADKVRQTFVGSNTIAGSRDYAHSINADSTITVDRYFFISNAYDINFCVHSLTANIDNVKIKTYIWAETRSSLLADIFTNITVFPDEVIFTFSNRDDQIGGRAEVFKSSESKDVVGLKVASKKVSEFVSSFYLSKLPRIRVCSIDAAKELMWGNAVEYVAALVYSIIKEILADRTFSVECADGQMGYSGVVGSFARILDDYQKKISETGRLDLKASNASVESLSDVDVLLFASDMSREKFRTIQEIADEICTRHSIPNIVEFRPTYDISPVKPSIGPTRSKVIFLQFIINDVQFVKSLRPSKLVVYDRLMNNKGFFKDKQIVRSYPDVAEITVRDLLEEPLGLIDLKRQLSEKQCCIRYWSREEGVMKERWERLEGEQLSQFADYVVKWSLVNFCRAYNVELPDSLDIRGLIECLKGKPHFSALNVTEHNRGDTSSTLNILNSLLAFASSQT